MYCSQLNRIISKKNVLKTVFQGNMSRFLSNVNTPSVKNVDRMLADIAVKNAKLKEAHFNVPDDFPSHSHPPSGEKVTTKEAFKKRLIYRSGQRGWLEVDLLLGKWAAENVPSMNDTELSEYESLLNMDTIEIFNAVSGQTKLKPEQYTPTIQKLIDYAKSSPIGKADPAAYAACKKFYSN